MQSWFQSVHLNFYLGYHPTYWRICCQYEDRQQQIGSSCLRTQPCAMSLPGVYVALIVVSWTGLVYLLLNGLLSWLRTAWMLRKLPKGPRNLLFGGVVQMMGSNRLRALQRINDDTVNGSGVFYFNALWRQVLPGRHGNF